MEKKINIDVENNEEIKQVKKDYKKIKKISLIIVLVALILLLINFTHDFIIVDKILKSNVAVYIGDNYKIVSKNGNQERIVYYKDGIKKAVTKNKNNEVVSFKDIAYFIMHDQKKYFTNTTMMLLYDDGNGKESLFSYMGWSEEEISKWDIIKFMITSGVRVGKDIYKDESYITVKMNMYKIWVNPETYYIEKEKLEGQVTETTIQKNVVTEDDVKVPDLSGYEEIINK